jgi:type VI secretion system secreted protein VgrG
MLSEEGIFYWFDHTRDSDWIVFAEEVSQYPTVPDAPILTHVGLAESLVTDERSILGLTANHRLRPARQTHGYFDVLRPFNLAPSESVAENGRSVELEAFSHAAEGLTDWMTAQPNAAQRLIHARARLLEAHGTSLCPHVAPAHTFAVSDHSEEALNSEYVVLRVTHEGSTFANGDEARRSYEAIVELAPRATPILIEPTETRLTHGLETATVMGPENEEVYTDGFGRVQVRFHWDRGPGRYPPVTAWVRVAQSWGGAGYGATFTPRVGNEVLVGFIDGDPDRPIIVGSVHNALTPATPRFPAERTRNGISTRSSPDSGSGHCLMFEDKRGEELVELRSAKTLVVSATEDNLVAAGSRYELRVGTDYAERVGGAHESSVGGDATIEFGANVNTRVAYNERRQVAGSATNSVGGNVDETVDGMVTTMIGSGRQVFVGRTGVASSDSLVVSGSYSLGAKRGIRIQSPTAIELVAGESRISILPDRILLESPLLQLQAEKAINLAQGPGDEVAASLVLAGGAFLSGGVATVASGQGGVLALDADAKLNGALVKLNCDKAEGGAADKVIDETKKGAAAFRVLPQGLPPGTTSVTLSIRLPSGEIEERECTVGSIVTIDGHPGEAVAVVSMKVAGNSVAYADTPQESEKENG